MAKIKEWNINTSSAEIFVTEKGDFFLIKDNNGDIATFRENVENIVVTTLSAAIVTINEKKKEIMIYRK